MTRLIDADALFENLDGMMAVSPTGYIHGDTVADMIGDAPTVDAVPVTRCRNCENFVVDEDQTYCMERYGQCDEDGFCAWAERKEE